MTLKHIENLTGVLNTAHVPVLNKLTKRDKMIKLLLATSLINSITQEHKIFSTETNKCIIH